MNNHMLISVFIGVLMLSLASAQQYPPWMQGLPQSVINQITALATNHSNTGSSVNGAIDNLLAQYANNKAQFGTKKQVGESISNALVTLRGIFNNPDLTIKQKEEQSSVAFKAYSEEVQNAVDSATQCDSPSGSRTKRQYGCGCYCYYYWYYCGYWCRCYSCYGWNYYG